MNFPSSVEELTSELVRIPSVNPDGDPGTDKVNEKACAEYLEGYLRSLGAETELREVAPDRPNVIGKFPSDRKGKPRLLFAPHVDTVSILGMIIDPFSGEIRDGKVWGRGSSDTKGPMASMLCAIKEIGRDISSLSHEIWFAGLADEEAGQTGSATLAEEEKFDFVLAGEPTNLDIVNQSKGPAWLVISAPGKAAHGATPEFGDNAIYKMAEIVRCLRDEVAPEINAIRDNELGASTLSVGIIHGGSKTNIVPDHCEVHIDLRLTPQAKGTDWFEKIQARLTGRWPEIEIRKSKHLFPLETPTDLPLIAKLQALGAKPVGAPWFSDASLFSAAGSHAVAIGPGSIAQAHTKDEFIAVADLRKGVEFFTGLLKSLT